MAKPIYSEDGSLVSGGSKPMDLLPIESSQEQPVETPVVQGGSDYLLRQNVESEVGVPSEQKPEVSSSGGGWDERLKNIESKFDQSQYSEEQLKRLKAKGYTPDGKAFRNKLWQVMQDEPTYAAWKESMNSNDIGAINEAYQNIKPEVIDIFHRIGTDLEKENQGEVVSIHKRQLQKVAYDDNIDPEEKLSQIESMSGLIDSSLLDPKSSDEISQVHSVVQGQIKTKKRDDAMSWMSDFEDKARVYTVETERLRNQEYTPQLGREYESRMQRLSKAYQNIPSDIASYVNENDKRPIDVRIKTSNDILGQDYTKWKMRTYNGLLASMRNTINNGGSVDHKTYKKWQEVVFSLTEDDATNITNEGNLPEGTIKEKVERDYASLARTKKSSSSYSRKSSMFDSNELMYLYIKTLEVR